MNTQHQLRSLSVLSNRNTLPQLEVDALKAKIKVSLLNMSKDFGHYNLRQYFNAKEDKRRGGEGICATKHFDN